jgi:UDP-2-acetamido-2,6-beta-L-arabino-hexul-4-ose reductase
VLKIAVTGASGLLGWHLRCRLASLPDTETLTDDRELFTDDARLTAFVGAADVIAHFAGMNRGPEAEIQATNVGLAEALVRALEQARVRPAVIFSSSIHIEGDSAYGQSKRQAGAILRAWAKRNGARFVNLVLPHVFGELGRPFYNSVVATFCHQLARGETPRVQQDATLSLLHAQDVADLVAELARSPAAGDIRPGGHAILVSELLAKLRDFAGEYAGGVVPNLEQPIDLALFNTYRSYLFPDRYPFDIPVREDARGCLFEAVKSPGGGQSFVSTTQPGMTRGNHYHRRKVERFLVIDGEAEIRIRRLFDECVVRYTVTGDGPQFVDMPTLHTHSITNIGNTQLLTLFWANEIFDPSRPDTEAHLV